MKKLFVVLVLAMLVLTACSSNPLLGDWTLDNMDEFLGSAEELQGMEEALIMEGEFTFNDDDTFVFAIDMEINFQKLFETMGMGDIELDSELITVSVAIDGDYELVDDDTVSFEVVDMATSIEPTELCMTFMGETQCLGEEELTEQFDPADFELEDQLGESSFQVDGDTLIMWDADCAGPDEDCALKLTKK